MSETFNIYCDESCHLENDRQRSMILGAIWCPTDQVREINERIREIKQRHLGSATAEVKWVKISRPRLKFYLDLVDYFFDNPDLHLRALIVPDKTLLNHAAYHQTHDDFYYKMYFDMLKAIFSSDAHYRIYLDLKDTRGGVKVRKLHEVLANSQYDFQHQMLERVQLVRSHEIGIMQMADVLLGAISYANRGLSTSEAKLAMVEHIRKHSGFTLTKSTFLRETKVNLFRWHASRWS